MKLKTYLPLVVLIFITLFFRAYNLQKLFTFDWDQERDANVVSSMIHDKKPVLIGPRVLNDSGFFVGPFHYYFLLPFYLLSNSNPFAGAYASVLVEILTVIAIYFVTLRIFGSKPAFFAAFIFSLNPSVVAWNVMYIPLFSILIFYLCYRLQNNNYRLFPLLMFLFVLSLTNHPSLLTLIVPIMVAYFLSARNFSLKLIILSVILSLIPLSTLILFDFRHDFINTKNIIGFIASPQTVNSYPWLFLRSFWRAINILIIPKGLFLIIERLLILFFGFLGFWFIKNRRLKILITFWIFTPLLLLSVYHGEISEYYYSAALILLPVLLGLFLNKIVPSGLIFPLVLSLVIFQYLNFPKNIGGAPVLFDKLQAVSFIVHQKDDINFNVSYDLPLGMNSGYKYLFKYLGREPRDIPEAHLFSVFLVTNPPEKGQIVYQNNIIGVVKK